jgi:hypothetical protein
MTAEVAEWLIVKARASRLQFMQEAGNSLRSAVISNQGRSKQPGNVIAKLKSIEPEFEASIARMRSVEKKQAAEALYAELKLSLPKLIALWSNESQLKKAITLAATYTGVLARYSYDYKVGLPKADAVTAIELEHNRLMPLERITYAEINSFASAVKEFDKLYIDPEVKAMSVGTLQHRDYAVFKEAMGEIEIEAFMEDAYATIAS